MKDIHDVLFDINAFNYTQLKKLKRVVDHKVAENQVGQALSEREDHVSNCPHCDSKKLSKWGVSKQGIQRFKCKSKSCNKTFTATKGTPVYRLRKKDKWLKYTELMWSGTSVRQSARLVGVNHKTAFKWRHRFLNNPTFRPVAELQGIIEADEAFMPLSFKGQKIPPHIKAQDATGRKRVQSAIAQALDRRGEVAFSVIGKKTKKNLKTFLKPILSSDSVLCTDANRSYKSIVKELSGKLKLEHIILNASANIKTQGVYHIQTLNNFIMDWKTWIKRFRGVATSYLPRYLAWHRLMKQNQYDELFFLRSAL